MLTKWKILKKTSLVQTPIFSLNTHTSVPLENENEEKKTVFDFYVLDTPHWVNVIPLLDGGESVLMIRQYRHGREEITLEIPGGMIDPVDVDPAAAAARELLEETGYQAINIYPLGAVAPNPAIQNNLCYSFVATEIKLIESQKLDSTEQIELIIVPLLEIPLLIKNGTINHALVITAFSYFFGFVAPVIPFIPK